MRILNFKLPKTVQKSCHSGFQPRYNIFNPSRYLCQGLPPKPNFQSALEKYPFSKMTYFTLIRINEHLWTVLKQYCWPDLWYGILKRGSPESGRGRNGNNQCFQCVQDRQSVRGRSQSFWLRCVSDDEVILMTKSVNMWNKGEHSGMLSICWGHVTGMGKLWKHWPSPYKAPSESEVQTSTAGKVRGSMSPGSLISLTTNQLVNPSEIRWRRLGTFVAGLDPWIRELAKVKKIIWQEV